MEYKYKGTNYELYLNNEGQIACEHNDISVVAATVEEAKELIRKEHVTEEVAEKTKVICNVWGKRHFAETSGKGSHGSVWVTYEDKGKKERAKVSLRVCYLDNEENRSLLKLADEKRDQCRDIEDEISAIEAKLTKYEM